MGCIQYFITLNRKGFFLKEGESAEEFLRRIHDGMNSEDSFSEIPADLEALDLAPTWVPIKYKQMPFWCGAYVEIYRNGRACITLPKKRSWGPSKDELISHELIHAARASMESDQYEEMVAHSLCSQKWRQKMATVLSSPTRRLFFIICVLGQLFYHLITLFYTFPIVLDLIFPCALLLLCIVEGGLSYQRWRTFDKVRRKLEALLNKQKAASLMIRLTDAEVNYFASLSTRKIYDYFALDVDLRRKVLFEMYFKKNVSAEKHCQC